MLSRFAQRRVTRHCNVVLLLRECYDSRGTQQQQLTDRKAGDGPLSKRYLRLSQTTSSPSAAGFVSTAQLCRDVSESG
jgi:hypothetical protein